jgi:hypothetical protein
MRASLGRPRIPYYWVDQWGNGYWTPKKHMRERGFENAPCGPDGPPAWAIAQRWNERWKREQGSTATSSVTAEQVGYVYFLFAAQAVKIGFSKKPRDRISDVRVGMAGQPEAILVVPGTRADERALHVELAVFRKSGEWFVAAPEVMRLVIRCLTLRRISVGSSVAVLSA